MNSRTRKTSALRRWASLVAIATIALAGLALMPASALALSGDFSLSTEAASLSTTQAGGHPDFVTKFETDGDPTRLVFGQVQPWAGLRDLEVQLPPGLLGDPAAFPQCSSAVFAQQFSLNGPLRPQCPADSQVGLVEPGLFNLTKAGEFYRTPLYNLQAPGGESGIVARLGFIGVFYPIFLDIRLDPKREDALDVTIVNIPSIAGLTGTYTTVWGTPTDPSHDDERFNSREAIFCGGPCGSPVPSGLSPTPFMSNPTSCGSTAVGFGATSYQDETGAYVGSAPTGEVSGCDQVPFQPSLSLQPTTRSAATASGLDFSLKIPQGGLTNPNGLATAHLKKAMLRLPEGISLNPSAADGLGSCSPTEVGVDRNERQIVDIKANGAPVALSFGGQTTSLLPEFASAAEVRSALEALPNIGSGGVAASGRPGGPWTVDFGGSLAGQDVPQIEGLNSELVRLAVKATGGTYTLSFDGDTTTPIAYDAEAPVVQAALEGLAGIEPGEVEVTGVPGLGDHGSGGTISSSNRAMIFRIAFAGGLSSTNVAPITATSSLTGAYEFYTDGPFARIYQLAEGGPTVQTSTVKQGGKLGFDGAEAHCPQSSKIGSGEITTPVLGEPLKASLYVARQGDNPFNSLLAGYLVAEGAGARIKAAGRFDLDPSTGQIVATFDDNPQQPFEDLELHLKGGNRGVVTTPRKCGTYQTSYELTPRSGTEAVEGTSEFTLDENCEGGGFSPGFSAGSENALAGAFATFATRVTDSPGAPALTGISVQMPEGVAAKLAGVSVCPDSALAGLPTVAGTGAGELARPSCPANSQVGDVVAGAGSGSPFYVKTGHAYLAGPYKGAPLSLAVITPAVAGPFDLGNVLTRVAVNLDPATARVSASSDPLPTMLEGVPLELRDVRVLLDRQGFAINPTNCEPEAASGVISGAGNLSANVSDRFQVGECAALGYKPKLALHLKGGTKRGGHPALTAVFRPRPGDANTSRVSVALPDSEFLDQSHIGTVCTRVQFAAHQCPAASIYGSVTARTPLLDEPLTGNVYLRSSNHKLPDLVLDLHGPASRPIALEASGRIDSGSDGGIRTTFEFVPDAPISNVTLKMRGAKKGLLENSTDLCARTFKASASFVAHNGRALSARPGLQARCRQASRGKHKSHG